MKQKIIVLLIFKVVLGHAQAGDTTTKTWRYSAWAEVFILPGEQDIFNPTFYARTKTLHFEARYNYEDINTASFWAGRRFEFGKKVRFILVPMAAVVLGNVNALSPGAEVEIMYGKFDFYSESEYVFDFQTSENNFYYQYGELAIRPVSALRTGLTVQRTKLIDNNLELQRGVFAEYYRGRVRAGLFAFSPWASNRFWIASVSVDF